MKGVVTDVATTKPITRNCVSEVPTDPNAAVSSNDPPVCTPNPSHYGSLMVRGRVAGQDAPSEASVGVAKSVAIVDRAGKPVAWADITTGSRVSVWITGEVMESYPVQVRATRLVVEPGTEQADAGHRESSGDDPPKAALRFPGNAFTMRPYGYCWASVRWPLRGGWSGEGQAQNRHRPRRGRPAFVLSGDADEDTGLRV
jgi:hypothetical protein